MKIRNQRREVCTPAAITDNSNTSRISARSDRSFSQSSLVKHTSAIFNNEKLEAKVLLMHQLIDEAKLRSKWEKFDSESLF